MCVLGLSPWGCIIGRVVSESGFNLGGGDRFPGAEYVGCCGFNRSQNICFSLILAKSSFWWGDWALGYHSMEFRHFPNVS